MPEPLLHVRGLQGYYGESHVLHGVDIDVFPGETVTLLGRNGAGKTTTLRAIMGILRRRQGTIRMGAIDLLATPPHRVARAGIGYVPEERGIFASLSVAENLTLPPRVAEGGMTLAEIHTLFPNLKERAGSQGTKLSGGEQQMLAIARVLRTGVKLLLLDEPTEGLAPVIVQRISELLRALKAQGMTILLVEQNFRFASAIADRHYVMEDGRVVAEIRREEMAEKMDLLHETLGV
jgi:branched-chain amino acid transport system ATP-binding protein